ncbi:hypothetical protein Hanom_Chr04g00348931 [Helianthus anomalus]
MKAVITCNCLHSNKSTRKSTIIQTQISNRSIKNHKSVIIEFHMKLQIPNVRRRRRGRRPEVSAGGEGGDDGTVMRRQLKRWIFPADGAPVSTLELRVTLIRVRDANLAGDSRQRCVTIYRICIFPTT